MSKIALLSIHPDMEHDGDYAKKGPNFAKDRSEGDVPTHPDVSDEPEHPNDEDGHSGTIKSLLLDAHNASKEDDSEGFVSSMHAAIKAGVEKFMSMEDEPDDSHVSKKDN